MFQFLATGLCGFIMGCASLGTLDTHYSYPSEWWKPVPENEAASWEILPQAADPNNNEVILSKRTELGIFSNLPAARFELDGQVYESLEGLWQSLKYPENAQDERLQNPEVHWEYTRQEVMKLTGFDAKKAGDKANENMRKLGITWVTYQGQKFEPKTSGAQTHYDLIYRASVAKVEQNPAIKALLIKTGNLKLLPDHKQDANVTPAYKFFEIYMKIRAGLPELQNQ
jgi:predicted NAD-dependent protein-ADP-ribosyltransferase YbiA (DUF1768 family)